MACFFAEQELEPLKLPSTIQSDDAYAIQEYINKNIGVYINRHRKTLNQLCRENQQLNSDKEKLQRTVEQMSKDIEQLKSQLKNKANATPWVL